ncbi:MAG: lipoprotein [Anaerosolibacter sp.]|jgi:hypothetical protein|uniref:hypothetical protein n=1 Tax=Anaerosolibacter sp. TaxID=1872527 RepID=UPI002627F623|nr:hypothetical protein [Anaerosolibacter sp.]MDF2546164.1 lipoprotein [Anaerosolibacter sp.]
MKKKIIILGLVAIAIVIALIVAVIGNPIVYHNNQKLKESVLSLELGSVSLNNVVPFDWDAVYTFDPYTSKSEIEDVLGFESSDIKETVNEGMVQLIFVRDQKIVSSVCGYAYRLGYDIHLTTGSSNYQKISYDDKAMFTVERKLDIIWLTHIK